MHGSVAASTPYCTTPCCTACAPLRGACLHASTRALNKTRSPIPFRTLSEGYRGLGDQGMAAGHRKGAYKPCPALPTGRMRPYSGLGKCHRSKAQAGKNQASAAHWGAATRSPTRYCSVSHFTIRKRPPSRSTCLVARHLLSCGELEHLEETLIAQLHTTYTRFTPCAITGASLPNPQGCSMLLPIP